MGVSQNNFHMLPNKSSCHPHISLRPAGFSGLGLLVKGFGFRRFLTPLLLGRYPIASLDPPPVTPELASITRLRGEIRVTVLVVRHERRAVVKLATQLPTWLSDSSRHGGLSASMHHVVCRKIWISIMDPNDGPNFTNFQRTMCKANTCTDDFK